MQVVLGPVVYVQWIYRRVDTKNHPLLEVWLLVLLGLIRSSGKTASLKLVEPGVDNNIYRIYASFRCVHQMNNKTFRTDPAIRN